MHYTSDYWKDVKKVIKNIPCIDRLYGKTLLITGATGMVCSSVVDIIFYLNKNAGADIKLILAGRNINRICERFQGILDENDFSFIEFDANVPTNINVHSDYIIHGASNANPAIYVSEPVETLLGNIIGLKCLMDLAKDYGSRLLFVSSSEVYGNRLDGNNNPYKEDDYGYVDILNPRACYPNGKRAAETLCASYAMEYGVDYVVVRLGHIYGPSITNSDTRASAEFTRDVISKKDIIMKSAGSQLRSYCYTLDCASAILTVLLNGQSSNAYNISNKNSIVSIRELAEALAKVGGVKVIYENPTDTEKKGYNLMNNSSLNSDKLEFLGWNAVFDLETGVSSTIKNY